MSSGLLFCPTCGNLLLIENHGQENLYCCETCPYQYFIESAITKGVPLKRKEVEPVLGGEEEWKTAAKTDDCRCPECGFSKAYYREVQIRSADEPATLFLRCVDCGNTWREG